MEIGKMEKHSPIVDAILEAEEGSNAEIHVHLSKRWLEWDPLKRAQRIFKQYEIAGTPHRSGILLYVNLRRKKFAILGDAKIYNTLGQLYWEKFLRDLAVHLRSTQSEKAIALAVKSLGQNLKRFSFSDPSKYDSTEITYS